MSSEAPGNIVFLGGVMGGIVEAITVQPLDMVKTRHQLLSNTALQPSILQTLKDIVNEGGFFRLYRGCLPEVSGMVPKTIAMYSSYEFTRRYINNFAQSSELTTLLHTIHSNKQWLIAAIAGCNSGVFEALTVTPFQVCKVRLQSKSYLGQYKNTFDCYKQIFKYEGVSSLYLGLGPTLWRNCVWNSVYFGLMYEIKNNYLPETDSKLVDVMQTLVSGFVGGTIATCFNAPFDVVKSRFQEQLLFDGNGQRLLREYNWTLFSLYKIYLNEGFRGCYRGFEAKVLRMGIGGAVCMGAFEATCLSYLHWKHPKEDASLADEPAVFYQQ